jgi:hypothetical protein
MQIIDPKTDYKNKIHHIKEKYELRIDSLETVLDDCERHYSVASDSSESYRIDSISP